jgi:multiple sugar transport system permease protein
MRNIAAAFTRLINDQKRVAYLFILPSLVIITFFVIIPMFCSIVFSFMDFNIMFSKISFVGIRNFIKLVNDERVRGALFNTFYFTVILVPLQVTVGLIVAVIIKESTVMNTIFRGVYFIPVICSFTIVALIWQFLLDRDVGIISFYLKQVGIHAGLLRDPDQAMPLVAVVSVWKNFGFTMVVFLAALQGIPQSLYEAANIDGINRWNRLFKITIPMMLPTVGFCVIIALIAAFQAFDQIYVMTGGGPIFRTETMVYYIYNMAFRTLKLPYASANAVVLFMIILVFSLFTFRRTSVHDKEY